MKPSLNMHGSWQQPQGRGAGRGVYGPGGKAGENGWQRKQHCMEANYSSIGHKINLESKKTVLGFFCWLFYVNFPPKINMWLQFGA